MKGLTTILSLPTRFDSEHYVRGVGHTLALVGVLCLGQAVVLIILLAQAGVL
jgi:hypothetical protein